MSRLSGVLGALQGLEKGMIGRDQAKSQLAQTLFDLQKYQETTLPESQQQVRESAARAGLYEAQTGVAREELAAAPAKKQAVDVELKLKQLALEEALDKKKELDTYKKNNPDVPVWSSALGIKTLATVKQMEKDIFDLENQKAIDEGYEASDGRKLDIRERVARGEKKAIEEETGRDVAKGWAEMGGAKLEVQQKKTTAETDIALGPVSVDKAIEELTQSRITTRERTAAEPYNIASYPLTNRLLQNRVDKSDLDWVVAQKYDMDQAKANLTSTQENTIRTKREIQRIDAEMKDKTVLDGIAANSGLTNPITNKPVTTWEDYKLVMNFKMDEQLAMVRAKSSGSNGLPTMSQNVDRLTLGTDLTLFGGKTPYKSARTVDNFISFIPHFLDAGQNPYTAWELAKTHYVKTVAEVDETVTKRFMAGYLDQDMVMSNEQDQQVLSAIQKEEAERARTSAAGGTPTPGTTPKVSGPPAPSGVREQVAATPGSIIESQDTTFGLDSATRRKIASIIDVYRNDPADLQKRLIKEIAKENDMNKRNQMALFAEDYVRTKR